MERVKITLSPAVHKGVADKHFKKISIADKVVRKKQGLICDTCNLPLEIGGGFYLCAECGMREDIHAEEEAAFSNYNNDPGASSSLKIVGKEVAAYQRHHIQMTSDYSKKKETDSRAEFDKLYSRSKRIEKPPKSVYDRASELFSQIQSHQVNRSGKRKGIKGACVHFEAIRAGMAKDKSLMADILNMSQTTLNRGIDALEILHADGLIDIPIYHDDEESFVSQNFSKYRIDKKYLPFVLEFIQRAEDKHIGTSSGPNSKCIGTIYLLAKLLQMDEVLDRLSKECEISKPTYTRFYKIARDNLDKFKKIFERHGLSYRDACRLN